MFILPAFRSPPSHPSPARGQPLHSLPVKHSSIKSRQEQGFSPSFPAGFGTPTAPSPVLPRRSKLFQTLPHLFTRPPQEELRRGGHTWDICAFLPETPFGPSPPAPAPHQAPGVGHSDSCCIPVMLWALCILLGATDGSVGAWPAVGIGRGMDG